MDRSMRNTEEAYLTEPECKAECESCGTKLSSGYCPYCDTPDYDPDERE